MRSSPLLHLLQRFDLQLDIAGKCLSSHRSLAGACQLHALHACSRLWHTLCWSLSSSSRAVGGQSVQPKAGRHWSSSAMMNNSNSWLVSALT